MAKWSSGGEAGGHLVGAQFTAVLAIRGLEREGLKL